MLISLSIASCVAVLAVVFPIGWNNWLKSLAITTGFLLYIKAPLPLEGIQLLITFYRDAGLALCRFTSA
jgi:hypothetical protein